MASEPDTTEVREQHRLDQAALERYLSQHLPGFPQQPQQGLTLRQYSSGQSNPTFYLKKGSRTYVLRKKPHGPLLPQAHRIDREYRIQKALLAAGFPVPEPLLYCNDASVIGTEFYVMQHVQGRIFRDMTLPEVSPAERSALYVALIETLARLHSFNVNSLGLQGYGRGAGFCKRQVSGWRRQYEAAAHVEIPAMNQLAEWLMNNLPPGDNEEKLVHGDFRLDNIIFHPREARVVAVLDWELSTVGHPLADLAYVVSFSFSPRPLIHIASNIFKNAGNVAGIPSFEELSMVYSHCRDISSALPDLNFFLALSYFKLAAISQGVYARYLLGNSSAESSVEFGKMVKPLAEAGLQLTKKTSLTTGTPYYSTREGFQQSKEGVEVLQKVKEFMKKYVFPAEKEMVEYYAKNKNSPDVWKKPAVLERLKEKAKAEGLWNLFLPAVSGLGQLDYALIAEETGKCYFAPEVFNCHAPDTGNMEVLHLYGTEEQKKQWLEPLLEGKISSCFCMTEPDVASSDATNMQCSLQRDGDNYIINGKKWWSSGAGNPNCKVAIVMTKDKNTSGSRYNQHSMIIVPMDTPGVKLIRPLSVFGYFDYHHGGHFEIHFNNVCVPASHLILGEGKGFEIAQGRLGPGRIHHCMRSIGAAEAALKILCERAAQRMTFGKKLYHHEVVAHWIAECRIAIEQARLLTLKAASKIDTLGNKAARKEVAMIKVAAPRAVLKVIDCAIQACGGAGFSDDFPLAQMFAYIRTLRVADGPDEVHLSAIAKLELLDQAKQLNAHL
ncbi:acyl-CoA dehydrogenase family member 11 isoform X2 [Sceloporus undulatus]|uniref:acyl-CoA dehydrogenase family member 11 isoform X2 n=1 Tax=Sceloporus undulatus TaxID=8520 RepID=UPI001C4B0A7E|nr:acyl-CoA dehydrogenase family member 11 isoform X2 [Sceloporus undulatus]